MNFTFALAAAVFAGLCARAQGVDFSAKIVMQGNSSGSMKGHKDAPDLAGVVAWLTPVGSDSSYAIHTHQGGAFRLLQKDKQFTPHVLVVPMGSSVEFPNHDPFFHNVFSLFNGKRFDLGLYEPGTSRSVRFDREGVSYIFCNIHPEMGAIVIALDTPYYALSTASGEVMINGVMSGSYRLHIWSETSIPIDPDVLERVFQVGSTPVRHAEIDLKATDHLVQHKNKFGQDYLPGHDRTY